MHALLIIWIKGALTIWLMKGKPCILILTEAGKFLRLAEQKPTQYILLSTKRVVQFQNNLGKEVSLVHIPFKFASR